MRAFGKTCLFLFLCAGVPAAAEGWIEGRLGAGDEYTTDGKFMDQYILILGSDAPRTPITIEMKSSDLDARLSVDGVQASGGAFTTVSDDDGGGGHDARLSTTLLPGVYFVRASSYASGATGSYRLRLAEPPGLGLFGPVLPLLLGQPVTGRLAEGDVHNDDGSMGDVCLFINPGTPARIEFTLRSSEFQPVLSVGTTARGDRGGIWSVKGYEDQPATFVIDVDPYEMLTLGVGSAPRGGRLGGYTLQAAVVSEATSLTPIPRPADPPPAEQPFVNPPPSVTATPSASLPAPTTIAPGAWVQGRLASGDAVIDDGSFIDDYALAVRPGDRIVVDILSNDFAPYFYLWGAGTSKNGTGSRGVPLTFEDTATESGTLTVRVNSSGSGAQSGAYRIRVLRTPAAASAGAPAARPSTGEETGWIRGRLAPGDEMRANGAFADSHVFRGRRGDTVVIRLESDAFDPLLFVSGPGAFMEMNDDAEGEGRNSRIVARLPAAGTYRVVVSSFTATLGTPGAVGEYRLKIETRR